MASEGSGDDVLVDTTHLNEVRVAVNRVKSNHLLSLSGFVGPRGSWSCLPNEKLTFRRAAGSEVRMA